MSADVPTRRSLAARLGAGLRGIREAAGMSRAEFAEHLGVHPTYIGTLERGQRNVTVKVLERLAAQLDVDPLGLLYPEFVSPTGDVIGEWHNDIPLLPHHRNSGPCPES